MSVQLYANRDPTPLRSRESASGRNSDCRALGRQAQGGGFFIQGKEPARAERRHAELPARLDHLSSQIDDLGQRLPAT